MPPAMLKIAPQSMQSLMLTTRSDGADLAHGTGFLVKTAAGPALITSRHLVTGRYQGTGKPIAPSGAVPDDIVIHHPLPFDRYSFVPQWEARIERLYLDTAPAWNEHPTLASRMDVVLLPLTQTQGIATLPYAMNEGATLAIQPAESVSVVGFPFALAGGGRFAVWAPGIVASEPEADYNDLPIFLVDCRTRPGQSGAPVLARRDGVVTLTTGKQVPTNGPVTRFLGMYSGRVHKEADLGMVWKASAIQELINSVGAPITLFKLWAAPQT